MKLIAAFFILIFSFQSNAQLRDREPGITKRARFTVSGSVVTLATQYNQGWINGAPSRTGAGNYTVTIFDNWYVAGSEMPGCVASTKTAGVTCQAIETSRTTINVRCYSLAVAILATLLPIDSNFGLSCWQEPPVTVLSIGG